MQNNRSLDLKTISSHTYLFYSMLYKIEHIISSRAEELRTQLESWLKDQDEGSGDPDVTTVRQELNTVSKVFMS